MRILIAEDEKMLAKAINDMFTEKLKESIGFTINIKNTSDILLVNLLRSP